MNPQGQNEYVFGPVPSRRLGLSLGVDIVPYKVCTLNCIYCQVGETTECSRERKAYVPFDTVISQIKDKINYGPEPDYITFSGSGEPTLNSQLGQYIKSVKDFCDIPVAVLTNGTLLYRRDVRRQCAMADVILPSLDAADQAVFGAINRPGVDITVEKLVSGLIEFRREYAGQIWLEIFLIESVNTASEHIEKLNKIVEQIKPDKIHINTAVRPTAQQGINPIAPQQLAEYAARFGPKAEVIADFPTQKSQEFAQKSGQDIVTMLKRRPCTIADIAAGLAMPQTKAVVLVNALLQNKSITSKKQGEMTYYYVN